jgi:purine-binding chemotaxis protein CheW
VTTRPEEKSSEGVKIPLSDNNRGKRIIFINYPLPHLSILQNLPKIKDDPIKKTLGQIMSAKEQFLVFGLNGNRFAISLTDVQRVVRVVEITPLPEPPDGVRGVINVEGQIIPVMDLRHQLHLPEAEITVSDYLIMVHNHKGRMALLVNEVLWIIERADHEIIPAENIFPGLGHIRGAVKVGEEIVLLHDIRVENIPAIIPTPDMAQV